MYEAVSLSVRKGWLSLCKRECGNVKGTFGLWQNERKNNRDKERKNKWKNGMR